MATADTTNLDALALCDEIHRRLIQVIGVVDLLGHVDPGTESLDDNSLNNASWLVKDSLKGVIPLVSQLTDKAMGRSAARVLESAQQQ